MIINTRVPKDQTKSRCVNFFGTTAPVHKFAGIGSRAYVLNHLINDKLEAKGFPAVVLGYDVVELKNDIQQTLKDRYSITTIELNVQIQ